MLTRRALLQVLGLGAAAAALPEVAQADAGRDIRLEPKPGVPTRTVTIAGKDEHGNPVAEQTTVADWPETLKDLQRFVEERMGQCLGRTMTNDDAPPGGFGAAIEKAEGTRYEGVMVVTKAVAQSLLPDRQEAAELEAQACRDAAREFATTYAKYHGMPFYWRRAMHSRWYRDHDTEEFALYVRFRLAVQVPA